MKNTAQTFWSRVDKSSHPGGCWLWTGCTARGYGVVSWKGHQRGAHRVAYLLANGALPEKPLELDHLCRNRRCVNPAHLEPVTALENRRRSPIVGRTRTSPIRQLPGGNNGNGIKTHCRKGHAFDEANTYHTPNGGRTCRACNRASAERTQAVRIRRKSKLLDEMIEVGKMPDAAPIAKKRRPRKAA